MICNWHSFFILTTQKKTATNSTNPMFFLGISLCHGLPHQATTPPAAPYPSCPGTIRWRRAARGAFASRAWWCRRRRRGPMRSGWIPCRWTWRFHAFCWGACTSGMIGDDDKAWHSMGIQKKPVFHGMGCLIFWNFQSIHTYLISFLKGWWSKWTSWEVSPSEKMLVKGWQKIPLTHFKQVFFVFQSGETWQYILVHRESQQVDGLGVPMFWYWTGPELYDVFGSKRNQVKINV